MTARNKTNVKILPICFMLRLSFVQLNVPMSYTQKQKNYCLTCNKLCGEYVTLLPDGSRCDGEVVQSSCCQVPQEYVRLIASQRDVLIEY